MNRRNKTTLLKKYNNNTSNISKKDNKVKFILDRSVRMNKPSIEDLESDNNNNKMINKTFNGKSSSQKHRNYNKRVIEDNRLRNNTLKNTVNDKTIYTDNNMNQQRINFKRKLVNNEYGYNNEPKEETKQPINLRKYSKKVPDKNIYTDNNMNQQRQSFKKKLINNEYGYNNEPEEENKQPINLRKYSKKVPDDKNIYTDNDMNQQRRIFKRKLTHNEYRNNNEQEEENEQPKYFRKIKTNKAKIRRFKSKSKHDSDNEEDSQHLSKTVSGNLKPQGDKAKIRKFQDGRYIINDPEYNNDLQYATYNQTAANYTNESNKSLKLADNRTINPKKVCERYERHNKSFKSSGNKNREYKTHK